MEKQDPNIPTIYSPTEVAELLSVTSETVCSWIRSGRLSAVGFGTDRLGRPCAPYGIRSDDLLEFLEERVAPTVTEAQLNADRTRRSRRPSRRQQRKLVDA